MKPRYNKYKNKKCFYDGIMFDSSIEMRRYMFLRNAEEHGEIDDLRRQVEFELLPKQTYMTTVHLKTKDKVVEKFAYHPCTYIADFVYRRNGDVIVEDVKGSPKCLDETFKIKEKMFYYKYSKMIKRVFNASEPLV